MSVTTVRTWQKAMVISNMDTKKEERGGKHGKDGLQENNL